MVEERKACLIYVAATDQVRQKVRTELAEAGYRVCEVRASLPDALAAQAGTEVIPDALADCIEGSNICVFLLPEVSDDDEGIPAGIGLAGQLGKRIVGVVLGARSEYPSGIELAKGLVRSSSPNLKQVICGEDMWEDPSGAPIKDRQIKHVRCQ